MYELQFVALPEGKTHWYWGGFVTADELDEECEYVFGKGWRVSEALKCFTLLSVIVSCLKKVKMNQNITRIFIKNFDKIPEWYLLSTCMER